MAFRDGPAWLESTGGTVCLGRSPAAWQPLQRPHCRLEPDRRQVWARGWQCHVRRWLEPREWLGPPAPPGCAGRRRGGVGGFGLADGSTESGRAQAGGCRDLPGLRATLCLPAQHYVTSGGLLAGSSLQHGMAAGTACDPSSRPASPEQAHMLPIAGQSTQRNAGRLTFHCVTGENACCAGRRERGRKNAAVKEEPAGPVIHFQLHQVSDS